MHKHTVSAPSQIVKKKMHGSNKKEAFFLDLVLLLHYHATVDPLVYSTLPLKKSSI